MTALWGGVGWGGVGWGGVGVGWGGVGWGGVGWGGVGWGGVGWGEGGWGKNGGKGLAGGGLLTVAPALVFMFISNLCSPLFVFKRGVSGSLYIVFVKVIIWVNSRLVHC